MKIICRPRSEIMSQSNHKIRIGILGAGGVSRALHLPVLVNIPDVDITWICDKDEQRARKLGKLFKIPAIFSHIEECSDVDIVLVAIPVGYRNEVMHQIFVRGWHAFCEKPFAVTVAEHDQYVAEARANKVQVGAGMVRRYSSATLMARKIVHGGYLGPILEVWAGEGARSNRTGQDGGWYMDNPRAAGGGVLVETGSHLIDQICTILNVTEFGLVKCIQRKFKGLEFETTFVGTVSTEQQSVVKCAFEVSRLEDLCNGIFIKFSNLVLKCGLLFGDPLELMTHNGIPIGRFDIGDGAKSVEQGFFLEWKDFLEQCISGIPSVVSADTTRQSIAIIEQCYKSAEVLDVGDARSRYR